ncbi:putative baseplate assembly protein [Myceligenerans crystallogenes]|uniref:Baseplate assembly protein n=1 Tax=Myceligenerans crystallogenes TaxID=316335 RepID=A0ABN2N9N9_9MICO
MTTETLPFAGEIDLEARRALVRGRPGIGLPGGLDGIDFVEVLSNHRGTPGHVPGAPEQRTLLVHLLNGPVPAGWTGDVVRVAGGVRQDPELNPVRVRWAWPAAAVAGPAALDPLEGVTPADRTLVDQALADDDARARALVVRTSSSGDLSAYTLRLVGPGGAGAPEGVDLPLSAAPFVFTVDCPSDHDCHHDAPGPAPTAEDLLPGDYLARDFEALRTRLLDRLATLLPDWSDRSPADPAVMLVELFAAVGDRLAYWQDAVAVEAYLSTARRRTSVRRHARLLGYAVHEGCSARTLVAFDTDTTLTLPAGTPVTDLPERPGVDVLSPADADGLGGTVFQTSAPVELRPERNALPLYAWGDRDHSLPAGATAAFVSAPAGTDPGLRAGHLLVLAGRPVGGVPRQGDPARRFAVRLIADAVEHDDPLDPSVAVWELRWSAADAPAAPLPVSTPGTDEPRAVALGNVVVADHGASVLTETLVPSTVPADGAYRPRLRRPGVAYVDPGLPATASASALLRPDPRRAGAALQLDDGQRTWTPRPDLLASGRLATHLVVEPEPGGVARLRFGDGLTGRLPSVGATPLASYRVGTGTAGNIAPDRLVRLLPRADGTDATTGAAVAAWNPLPATGGTDPERLERVRQLAPAAFRRQLRAVTSQDYAAVAEEVPGTQRAVARRRWTGSWYAQDVTVDAVDARAGDPAHLTEVTAALDVRRMAGVDVELGRPVYVPLEIVLRGCTRPGYLRADVGQQVREVFSSGVRADGGTGFFHPDRFTFGRPLRLSDVVAAAMAVDGLAWVEPVRFARRDATRAQAAAALAAGEIEVSPRELLRCDSDPNNPEAGRLELRLGGGS